MRSYREIPKLIALLFDAGLGTLRQTAVNVQKRMAEDGKPVRYPIDWDSQRQQRFVMWKLRKSGELPYRRKNRYRFGWHAEFAPFGARVWNRRPAGAIGGTTSGWQSRIHRGRWPHLLTVLFDELKKVPADLSNRLKVVAGNR
jgi:hypothetical protein